MKEELYWEACCGDEFTELINYINKVGGIPPWFSDDTFLELSDAFARTDGWRTYLAHLSHMRDEAEKNLSRNFKIQQGTYGSRARGVSCKDIIKGGKKR